MSVLVWVHDHIVWLLLGVVPCAAAITWGLWLGRYQPVHAGGPAPERLWPLVGDPRAGSMQLAEDAAWMWQGGQDELAHRSLNGPPLDWREVAHEEDWRDQTARDLAPAVLDTLGGDAVDSRRAQAGPVEEGTVLSSGPGVETAQASLAPPGPDPDDWLFRLEHVGPYNDGPAQLDTPEPEPVWTVAGRLVETSGEWLRRLERDAGPGWTYAGTVAA